ncbi:hypothetical protein ACFL1A_02665 [Patescibacteria group bacterium]
MKRRKLHYKRMRKKAKSKVTNTSFIENPIDGSGRGVPKIQLNPLSAFARNESKLYVQQVLSGLSMLAIFAVVAIGGLGWVQKKQSVTVDANVNYKKSIQGIVTSVDNLNNNFSLQYKFSVDPDISQTNIDQWKIGLPPGEFFGSNRQTVSATCYTVQDLKSQTNQVTPARCDDVVRVGKEVLVEHVVLKVRSREMIAKTILGEKK